MQTNATGWTPLTTPVLSSSSTCRFDHVMIDTSLSALSPLSFYFPRPSLPTVLFHIGHWSGFDTTATYSLLFIFNALIAFNSHIIKCASSFTSPSIPHRKQRNEINTFIQKTFKKKDKCVFYVFYWLWNISKNISNEIFQTHISTHNQR